VIHIAALVGVILLVAAGSVAVSGCADRIALGLDGYGMNARVMALMLCAGIKVTVAWFGITPAVMPTKRATR